MFSMLTFYVAHCMNGEEAKFYQAQTWLHFQVFEARNCDAAHLHHLCWRKTAGTNILGSSTVTTVVVSFVEERQS